MGAIRMGASRSGSRAHAVDGVHSVHSVHTVHGAHAVAGKSGADAVDGAAIRRVAERLLSERPTITALGPVPDLEDLEKLAAAPS